MAKDDPRLPLLEKQQEDLYREAVQRSGRPWKAIAGRAIKRPKTLKNDSSSSSAAFMPTSEESTSTHSLLMKAHASPGTQRAGMPSQSANFGSHNMGLWTAECTPTSSTGRWLGKGRRRPGQESEQAEA